LSKFHLKSNLLSDLSKKIVPLLAHASSAPNRTYLKRFASVKESAIVIKVALIKIQDFIYQYVVFKQMRNSTNYQFQRNKTREMD